MTDEEKDDYRRHAYFILKSLEERAKADERLDEKLNESHSHVLDEISQLWRVVEGLKVKITIGAAVASGAVTIGIKVIEELLKK
jgi:hypothetical protein